MMAFHSYVGGMMSFDRHTWTWGHSSSRLQNSQKSGECNPKKKNKLLQFADASKGGRIDGN